MAPQDEAAAGPSDVSREGPSGTFPGFFALAWPAGVYFILCGAIPLSLMIYEYGAFSWTILGLYGALFLYPLLFGWVSVALATPPYLYVMRGIGVRRRVFSTVALGAFALAAGVTVAELTSENIGPYELKPEVLTATLVGEENIVTYFNSPRSERRVNVDCAEDAEHPKCAFQLAINAALGNKYLPDSNWSMTRYAYIVSFVVQAFALIFYLIMCSVLVAFRSGYAKGEKETDIFYNYVFLAISSLAVAMLWLFFRVANTYEKLFFFPEESLALANIAIVTVYTIAIMLLTISLYFKWGTSIIAMFASIYGAGGLYLVITNQAAVADLFGRENAFMSCLIIALVLMAAGYLFYVFSLFREHIGEDDAEAA